MIPFISFFFLWIVFFSLLAWILKVETGDDYPGLGVIWQYLIMTYRNSIGDLTPPAYGWLDTQFPDDKSKTYDYMGKNFMISIIWIIWLIN